MHLLLQYCLVVNTCAPLEEGSWKRSEKYEQYSTNGMMLYFAAEAWKSVKWSIGSSLITLCAWTSYTISCIHYPMKAFVSCICNQELDPVLQSASSVAVLPVSVMRLGRDALSLWHTVVTNQQYEELFCLKAFVFILKSVKSQKCFPFQPCYLSCCLWSPAITRPHGLTLSS